MLITIASGILGAFFAGLFQGSPGLAQGEAAGPQAQKAIVTNELRLVDDKGITRLVMALVLGKPRLLMLDEQGQYRLELGLGTSGEPRVWLRDKDGASKAQMALTPEGLPSFALADQKGNDRAVLALTKEGNPTFVLRDRAGKDRVAVWRGMEDEGVALADDKGMPIAYLTAKDGEAPVLSH
ncbi:MAG: hypothetical protein LBF40_05535 [Deltaproteobacteria bacterium]|nr:hypothetical protein [Deltaproteobacteria bacterium]